jgi:hypothetical protein
MEMREITHDPKRAADQYANDGESEHEYTKIPFRATLTSHVKEKDKLDEELEERCSHYRKRSEATEMRCEPERPERKE